jgi:hypothetical protein
VSFSEGYGDAYNFKIAYREATVRAAPP